MKLMKSGDAESVHIRYLCTVMYLHDVLASQLTINLAVAGAGSRQAKLCISW